MGNQVSYSGDLSFDMSTPPTPFNQPTPGGLQSGKVMFIEGETMTGVNGQADRFNVNFHTSTNDTLLHYDVRFWPKDTAIIINSRHQGTWQKEERLQNTVPKNRLFRIDVQITPTGLIITQDQMRPYTFHYRHGQTPDKIRNITIEGNIKIKRVFYGYPGALNSQPHQQQQPPPYQSTQSYAPPNPQYQQSHPAYQPPTYQMPSYQMPQTAPAYQAPSYHSSPPTATYGNYSAAPSAPGINSSPYPQVNTGVVYPPKWIQGGMSNGRQIIIQGTPHANADRFSVDLNGPAGTIALHLSIRFSEQAFVRNSMRSNTWENEERYLSTVLPFVRNQPFEIQILSDHSGYKIAVNGRHTADFFHRMDAQMVQSVSVTGDVNVIDVRVF